LVSYLDKQIRIMLEAAYKSTAAGPIVPKSRMMAKRKERVRAKRSRGDAGDLAGDVDGKHMHTFLHGAVIKSATVVWAKDLVMLGGGIPVVATAAAVVMVARGMPAAAAAAAAVMVARGMPAAAAAAAAVMVARVTPVAAAAAVIVMGATPVVATAAMEAMREGGSLAWLARTVPRGGRAAAAALWVRLSCRGVLVPVPGASPVPCLATRFPPGRRRMTLRSGVQKKRFGRAVGRRGAARRVTAVWRRTHPFPWETPTARLLSLV